ncbi:vacuolar protein sorting-associated protein 55 homolog isoform X3 [Cicer arietinum]|uniref:Vacuolar protein sorting-associated protein 55 homolog isoform X3 n=1 Tax=Cicer arietinum TaxID=3827 RepID=A0A3Q7XF96_CICAR|nr:vacuolar protein sorting-associated protein 55 homolog isoform X3 [Cicer arietinum]
MAELPGYVRYCLHTCKLVLLAILVSGGIVLQILLHICSMWQACSLFNNWWPMLTGSESSLFSDSDSRWVNATKFLTGASAVGSIAIPAILKHSDVIGWGALAMELSSFFVFVLAIMCYIKMSDEDGYSSIL